MTRYWVLMKLRKYFSGVDPGAHPPPPKIGKNMIFLRKIVIFHMKYHKRFCASLCSAQFFKCALPNLISWIRPCFSFQNTVIQQSILHHQKLLFNSPPLVRPPLLQLESGFIREGSLLRDNLVPLVFNIKGRSWVHCSF